MCGIWKYICIQNIVHVRSTCIHRPKQEQNEQRPATQIWEADATHRTYNFRHTLAVEVREKLFERNAKLRVTCAYRWVRWPWGERDSPKTRPCLLISMKIRFICVLRDQIFIWRPFEMSDFFLYSVDSLKWCWVNTSDMEGEKTQQTDTRARAKMRNKLLTILAFPPALSVLDRFFSVRQRPPSLVGVLLYCEFFACLLQLTSFALKCSSRPS